MDLVFLTRLWSIFRWVFSLLPATFPLLILVLFLPLPHLSSFFLFWEFCGLKVPKTTYPRTIRKYPIFWLVTDDDIYEKAQNAPWVIVLSLGILLVAVTGRLVSVWGWFEGSSENWTLTDFFFLFRNLSLSRSFCLFSLCRYPDGAGSNGLKVGHAVAVVSCGFCETRRSPENSRVFRRLSFFFSFSRFLIFSFFFFLSRVVTLNANATKWIGRIQVPSLRKC